MGAVSRLARRLTPPLVALLAAGLLAGCVAPVHQVTPTAGASVTPEPPVSAPPGAERFYSQQVDWSDCQEADECAQVEVPLDWAAPDGPTVKIAVARVRATDDDPAGSILVNPGGPGASAVDFLSSARLIVSPEVRDEFDLVAFDPRGVQRSTPVTCLDGPGTDALFAADFDMGTDAGIARAEGAWGDFGAACAQNTGEALGHIDTVTAARDMDLIRALVGDQSLNYLGYSYGTKLGATYAALFPERVGRLVLDSALDPTLDGDEVSAGQAVGFESALRAYVTDCLDGDDCPLTGTVDDALGQISDLLETARANPLPTTGDMRVTAQVAFTGIAYPLYSQALWPDLTAALRAGFRGDGTVLLALAYAYADRAPDGTYTTNQLVAFPAINCVDDRADSDVAEMRAKAAEIERSAPTLGRFFAYSGVQCARWPVPPVGGLDDYSAAGAAPILVIGTTNDPATPYVWAQSLAKTLESGVLLTHEGEGHGVYGIGNACATAVVDDYFLDGTVPDEGTRC